MGYAPFYKQSKKKQAYPAKDSVSKSTKFCEYACFIKIEMNR